ncbi:squalene/phytoene synthase family protein, partial [Roseicyclus amphidinii]|uniref:squalene/phytoene synthase family protein n=1 Tax=Roseicyclus amphidinii TaxID=3034232 RepID=UPI0024E131B3
MSLQACADLVARGDPDRFRATMAAPVAARRVLFPLYAFNIEVSRAPWVTDEPLIAEMRLQFWRDVVEELAAGKPPRAHEVALPLADAIPADVAGALDPLVTARQWDIYREPFEDRAAFDAYIADTAVRRHQRAVGQVVAFGDRLQETRDLVRAAAGA